MIGVQVQVMRCVDDSVPGFVECELVDAHGRRWVFMEKAPVVASEYLSANDTYPRPGVIACEVITRTERCAHIDTARPWGVESTEGETRFEVPVESLVDL
jgi:hypothetical protein